MIFEAHVEYEYEVYGVHYTGTNIQYGLADTSIQRFAESKVAAYPADGYVDVYYDPACPSRAVLIPGTSPWCWVFFAFGAIFLGVGIVALAK